MPSSRPGCTAMPAPSQRKGQFVQGRLVIGMTDFCFPCQAVACCLLLKTAGMDNALPW